MYKKATSLVKHNNFSSANFTSFSGETLQVDKLVKISAVHSSFDFSDSISGTVRQVDIRTLKAIDKLYFDKKIDRNKDSFVESGEYIRFSYQNKPTIYINKKDGLVYAFKNGVEERKQAWHLFKILGKFGYIENYHREQHRKQKSKNLRGWKN